MSAAQGDVMVGNVKSLVNRLSKDFSASKSPLSVQESRKSLNLKASQPLQHVITTFAYSAAQDDELSLELGDIIEVLEEVEDGWSRGRQLRTNIIGMFPTNFVKPSVPSSTIREEEKVVIRASVNPDQPEANRRTPSVVGGVNTVAGKAQAEVKDEPKTKEMARVKFEYEPQHSDELRLGEIGQLITIIRKDCGDAGWFEGEINGRRGLFPDNFVELVQVPINTQSGMIYHPPPPQHVKVVAKPPMVNPVGMVPPAVPAKPLKQKLSDSSMSINGSSVLTPSTTTVTIPSHVMPCNVKHQSSAFAAARDRISKDLIVGQPGQMSSKLTKSAIVNSGNESIVPSRPMSSVEMESVEDMTSPLSHVTKTRARPPGKRPATLLLSKKKESLESFLESPSKSVSNDTLEKASFASVALVLPSSVSTHPIKRESVPCTTFSSSNNPAAKVLPIRPPPAEVKVEEKKECIPVVKTFGPSQAHPGTSSISSNADAEWEYIPTVKASGTSQVQPNTSSISSNVGAEWVSRSEYNELLARLASMEARIEQLERR